MLLQVPHLTFKPVLGRVGGAPQEFVNPSLQAATVGLRRKAAGEALPVSVRDIDGVGAMNALADYGSSSDDDGSGDEAMPPAPAPAPAPAPERPRDELA